MKYKLSTTAIRGVNNAVSVGDRPKRGHRIEQEIRIRRQSYG